MPSAEGDGEIVEHQVKISFELMTRSEARAVESDLDKAQGVLPSKVLGWEGVYDADGAILEFTPDNLAALLDVAYIERAFAIGLIQASNGAPAKN